MLMTSQPFSSSRIPPHLRQGKVAEERRPTSLCSIRLIGPFLLADTNLPVVTPRCRASRSSLKTILQLSAQLIPLKDEILNEVHFGLAEFVILRKARVLLPKLTNFVFDVDASIYQVSPGLK
jgi:hypothetical protein